MPLMREGHRNSPKIKDEDFSMFSTCFQLDPDWAQPGPYLPVHLPQASWADGHILPSHTSCGFWDYPKIPTNTLHTGEMLQFFPSSAFNLQGSVMCKRGGWGEGGRSLDF